MYKSIDRRRRRHARVTAVLTIVIMLAGGAVTFGAVSAIGKIEIVKPVRAVGR